MTYSNSSRTPISFLRAPILVFGLMVAGCQAPPELPNASPPQTALRPVAERGVVPEESRIADYRIEARLDAETHRITGSAQVSWRNTTEHSVDTIPFHLYINGFRSEDTAWMQSSGGRHRDHEQEEEGAWGYIEIEQVRRVSPGPLLVEDEAESPATSQDPLQWSEDADPSTMTVTLPEPVAPGETLTLAIDFETQLPKVVARTGYHEDFHAVAQWYPKIGVLETDGTWQAHTYTVNDEYFADFGNYTVEIDVPENMVVGASGIPLREETADGRKKITYQAEMVHDFAWMADPSFVEHSLYHDGVYIRQLIQPEKVGDADLHMATQIAALDSYQQRFGPYPWSTITIVHAPEGAEGAGGMEYPTLYTTSDAAQMDPWIRKYLFDERMSGAFTTVHEFGHQYFQGLFASREHLEPWLDEGMNSFTNQLAFSDRYGEDPWAVRLLSNHLRFRDGLRATMRMVVDLDPVAQPASAFHSRVGSYFLVYAKTSAIMMTLRNVVGHQTFDDALAVYAERARFRHPTGQQLFATLISELGGTVDLAPEGTPPAPFDVAHFLDQAFHTTYPIDFAILRVNNVRRQGTAGWQRNEQGELIGGEAPDLETEVEDLPDDQVTAVVVVHRPGAFQMPVDLLVEFADGSEIRQVWNATTSTRVFEWPGKRIRRARLDPDNKLILEWRRLNNTAWARDLDEHDGFSRPLGDLVEGISLALLGAVGP